MLAKIWNIAWKDLYVTYTDRSMILIMLITPLALATIIGTAFSGFFGATGNDVPISNIPVAIVNLDRGVEANGNTINNGDIFVRALVPPADATEDQLESNVLFQLTTSILLTDADQARAGVGAGEYAVAVIIPSDFSERITYTQDHPTLETAAIELVVSESAPVSANVMRSVISAIGNQIATGSITVAATIDTLVQMAGQDPAFGLEFAAASLSGDFQPNFSPAFTTSNNPLVIDQQTITGESVNAFNPLVLFGSAQAVFFMLFTAMGTANSILEEKRDGTLQRLIISPTPRVTVLLGKLLSTFLNCWVQIILLFAALTVVGSVLTGQLDFIWGDNLIALFAVIFATAFAASGLGTLAMSFANTPEQGNIIGSVISLAFGVLSGAFFSVQAIPFIATFSRLTLNYWGVDAFTQLALGSADILPNLSFLLVFGAVTFTIGMIMFNRRLEF